MLSESQCRFCAKLPVVHHMNRGCPTRCPLCKGHLIEDRDTGTTYRYEETTTATPARKSLGSKLAALFGISATAILIWLLVKPHVPEATTVAAQRPAEIRPVAAMVPDDVTQPVLAAASHGEAKERVGYPWVAAKQVSQLFEVLARSSKAGDWSKGAAKSRPDFVEDWSCVKGWNMNDAPRQNDGNWPVHLTEEALVALLGAVPEVGVAEKLKPEHLKKGIALEHRAYLDELKRLNPDLVGLPFLLDNCQLSTEAAKDFGTQVSSLRQGLYCYRNDANKRAKTTKNSPGSAGLDAGQYPIHPESAHFEDVKLWHNLEGYARSRSRGTESAGPARVAAMQQLMTDQPITYRRVFIASLNQASATKFTTVALARRALFDLDADVRLLAIQTLEARDAADYLPLLLKGFEHPWPIVAQHAAFALVALQRRDVMPKLMNLLNAQDPDEPFVEGGKVKIRELVRINHHRNCLACHAPADRIDRDSPRSDASALRASIPLKGAPLPEPFTFEYYHDRRPNEGFVRADVTYLRQDFSSQLPVTNPGRWPALQRFDFFVRVRELTPQEAAAEKMKATQAPRASEHKRAIVAALSHLTGIDAGDATAAAWNERLSFAGLRKDLVAK